MKRKDARNRAAVSILEYAVVLGMVSMMMVGMFTYVKRGLQGRVADMSDYFIGTEHAGNADPTARITSNTSQQESSNLTLNTLEGSEMQLALLSTGNSEAQSEVRDLPTYPHSADYIPAERGYINVPERPTEEDIQSEYDIEKEKIKARIRALEQQKQTLIAEADSLEASANRVRTAGQNLINTANRMRCPRHHGGACRAARTKMRQAGQQMVREANATMQEVLVMRQQIAQLQRQIDLLNKQLS